MTTQAQTIDTIKKLNYLVADLIDDSAYHLEFKGDNIDDKISNLETDLNSIIKLCENAGLNQSSIENLKNSSNAIKAVLLEEHEGFYKTVIGAIILFHDKVRAQILEHLLNT